MFGYIDNYVAQVVTGQISLEDTWNDFQKTLKTMEAETYEAAYKTAYEKAVG